MSAVKMALKKPTIEERESSALHVVVLDEFDAIARKRTGSSSTEGGASRDSVVNQLLALIDGVAPLPRPTLVIALTNRRELVDDAVLRPGRLEVQVEVGKPNVEGRAAILGIHASKMRKSGRLALLSVLGEGCADGAAAGDDAPLCDVDAAEDGENFCDDATFDSWVLDLAAKTEGFSGAALAGVVRAAVARALDRAVSAGDPQSCRVYRTDFDAAIADLRTSSLELEELDKQYAASEEGRSDAAAPDGDERVYV